MPLFFLFDLSLEARAEISEIISLLFWDKRLFHKDILKLSDLYLVGRSSISGKKRVLSTSIFDNIFSIFQVETTTTFYKPMLAIYGLQLENIF